MTGSSAPTRAAASTAETPTPTALEAIDALLKTAPVMAKADKRGKFPMGQMVPNGNGASFDIEPLAYAMTGRTFLLIHGVMGHLPAIRAALVEAS